MSNLVLGNGHLLTSAETGFPRISKPVYEVRLSFPLLSSSLLRLHIPHSMPSQLVSQSQLQLQLTFVPPQKAAFILYLAICILSSTSRLYLKLRSHRHLELDDGFLLLAVITSISAWVLVWQFRDLVYLQMELVLGMKAIELADADRMLSYFKLYNASLVLSWTSVYSVKLSFIFFFRKLILRVRVLEIYWWVVLGVVVPTACFAAGFGFFICSDFSLTYLGQSFITTPSLVFDLPFYADVEQLTWRNSNLSHLHPHVPRTNLPLHQYDPRHFH